MRLINERFTAQAGASFLSAYRPLEFRIVSSAVEYGADTISGKLVKWNPSLMGTGQDLQETIVHELGHVLDNRTNCSMRDWASSGLDNNYRLPAIIEVASKDRARTEEDTSGAEELTANHFLNWVYQSYTYGALPGSGIDTFDPAGDDREKRITAYWLGIEAELSITTVGPGPGIAEWIAASDPDGECF